MFGLWTTYPVTPIVQGFEATPGFDSFEQRRKTKYNKVIAGNASLPVGKGMMEGVDRQ